MMGEFRGRENTKVHSPKFLSKKIAHNKHYKMDLPTS